VSVKVAPTGTTEIGWLYVAAAGVWAGGAALLLALLAFGGWSILRLRRAGMPIDAGDAPEILRGLCDARCLRPPLLLSSAAVQGPVLTGLWRPAILLPASWEQDFDCPALRAVLAHELAHLARGDCGWLLLVRLMGALGWMQPLLWALCRRLEQSSEAVCDQEALQESDPRAYARFLVDLAERLRSAPASGAVGIGIVPCRSSLEWRVRTILNSPRRPAVPLSAAWRAAIMLGLLAAAGLGLMLVSVAAAPLAKAPKDPLAADIRLAQQVRVKVEGLPVGDLLSLLAEKTGVPLTASRETTDDKVMIYGPARPLRDELGDLAALFNDRWEHLKAADHSDRYVLIRDLAAQRYEAALANAVTARMLAQLAEQVQALKETPEQLARRPEHDRIRTILSDEVGRLGTLFYAALSREQREALFARRRLDIPFSDLSPEYQAPLREAFARRIAMEQEFARQVQEQDPGRRVSTHRPDDLEQGALRFRIQRTGGFVSVGLDLGMRPLAVQVNPDEHGLATSGWPVALLDSRAAWLLPPHGSPYSGQEAPEHASLPTAKAARAAAAGEAWPDRLRKLADGSGIALMADYYRGKSVAKPPDDSVPAAEADAPAGALDALCRPVGYLWWMRGKTLLLRKRDWYQQRLYEVPDRWMLSMAERLKADSRIPACADVLRALDLTAEQIAGMNSLPSDPYVYDQDELTGLRELLAIVQASPNDKSAPLPAGALHPAAREWPTLQFNDLTPEQRHLLPACLEAQDSPIPPANVLEFSVRLSCSSGHRETTVSGYRYMPVKVEWSWGTEVPRRDATLSLPASLPDDRRDRTRIEVLP
jgi:beta-lactamase regulating signal transducer with metallopeptidase domain